MVYLLGNTSPLLNGDGRARGAVAALTDVTALKEIDEALRRAPSSCGSSPSTWQCR